MDIHKLREIGWKHWNPIGLPGPPATPIDEYDIYLLEASRRIENLDLLSNVADYLVGVEQHEMKLNVDAAAQARAFKTVVALHQYLFSLRLESVKTKMSSDGLSRLTVYRRRRDGLYFYSHERLLTAEHGPYWLPDDSGLYLTAEEAERDATGMYPWLRNPSI